MCDSEEKNVLDKTQRSPIYFIIDWISYALLCESAAEFMVERFSTIPGLQRKSASLRYVVPVKQKRLLI